ncbi:MAG: uroporphyrinogen-III synthase [Oceanobacter sp.]
MTKLVVTRPEGQADGLIQSLQALGHQVVHCPLMKIEPLNQSASGIPPLLKHRILNIDEYDAVISISANASDCGLELMDEFWPQFPIGIDWYAVGPASAKELQQAGMKVRLPVAQFDSEGLLALPSLKSVAGKKILIWRGVGGRETLAQVLQERGAHVDYAELYERQQQSYPKENWVQILAGEPWLVLSSGQALDIVQQQVTDLGARIQGLILPSQRVAQGLDDQQFPRILVPASARDVDVLGLIEQEL